MSAVDNQHICILVVEGNSVLRKVLCNILEVNRYTVYAVANESDGLAWLQRTDRLPHIIIADLDLLDINGEPFMKMVSQQKKWNTIRFIFLSSYPDTVIAMCQCQEPRVIACLDKPFSVPGLLDIVAQASSATGS